MDTQRRRPKLPPAIERLLDRLRMRIRLYVWTEGIAATLVVLGAAFWIGLAIDWVFEPSRGVRALALTGVVALAAAVVYRFILVRAFVRLADTSMAVLLERRFDHFRDSLVTSVELAEAPEGIGSFSQEMLDHTGREAVDKTADIRLGEVFSPAPLVQKATVAAMLLVSVVAFGVYSKAAFGFWLERIALGEELWPRRTLLKVDGFAANDQGIRAEKVARDSDFDLVIKADAGRRDPPPRDVEIRYRLADGSRGRGMATRVGQANPGRDEFQIYRYTFDGITAPVTFDVVGGDDRIDDLQLVVVDRPQFVEMVLDCKYPAYLERQPRRLNVTGMMQVPEGTEITLLARTNKDLVEVRVVDPERGSPLIHSFEREDRRQFEYVIPRLVQDRPLLLSLKDVDGIETDEPYRLSIFSLRDEVPEVGVQLYGIGTAIVPGARIPVVGKIKDDYGMERAWFEYQVDGGPPQSSDFDSQPTGRIELGVDQSLDTRALDTDKKLQAKQKLVLSVKVSDRYDLGSEPHVGSSQRFLLDVVTPEQLRSILERRELTLRQRFKTVYNRMTETRDRLSRIDFGVPTPEIADNRGGPQGEHPEDTAAEPGDRVETEDSAEPGDEAEPKREFSPERVLARRRLRIVGALQNVEQAAHETMGVALAFDDIREELINNRIDTEELTSRLKEGISDPLRRIGKELLPGLQIQIEQLKTQANDARAGPAQLRQVTSEADMVLVEMKQILDRMLELESYNEVVEMLHGIIKDQDNLNEKTKQRRKNEVRRLLEE